MMRESRKGQVFIAMIIVGLAILLFLFASPMIWTIVSQASEDVGGVPGFIILMFPWVILATLFAFFFRILTSGAEFL